MAWSWQGPSWRTLRGTQTVSVPLGTILEEILWVHRAGGSQQCWRKVCANHQGDLGTDRQMD